MLHYVLMKNLKWINYLNEFLLGTFLLHLGFRERIADEMPCEEAYIPCGIKDLTTGGGGGGTLPYVCILGMLLCERPPFSALNFLSGRISFSQIYRQKCFTLEHHHFNCKADFTFFALPETIIFKMSFRWSRSSPPTAWLSCLGSTGLAASQSARFVTHGQRLHIFYNI